MDERSFFIYIILKFFSAKVISTVFRMIKVRILLNPLSA